MTAGGRRKSDRKVIVTIVVGAPATVVTVMLALVFFLIRIDVKEDVRTKPAKSSLFSLHLIWVLI